MAESVTKGQGGGVSGPSLSVKIMVCSVCKITEGISRCARCKVAAYCGIEHRGADCNI
jgi:hypothetical protein